MSRAQSRGSLKMRIASILRPEDLLGEVVEGIEGVLVVGLMGRGKGRAKEE